jgi:hypothetical protein
VDFVVCTLAVKKKIRAGFDLSDRTIPLSVVQLRYDVATMQSDVTDDVAMVLLTLFTNHLVSNKYLDSSGWDTFCKM